MPSDGVGGIGHAVMKATGITEFDIVEALQQPGCPLCRIARSSEILYMKYFLTGNAGDPDTRKSIVEGGGFCRRHAWEVFRLEALEWGVPLGNGLLYEDLVQATAREMELQLDQLRKAAPGGPVRRLFARVLPKRSARRNTGSDESSRLFASCRVCRLSDESAGQATRILRRLLDSEEMRRRYRSSDGLCYHHLQSLTSGDNSSRNLEFLLEDTLQRLTRLGNSLCTFKQKQAWERRDENLTEDERDAVKNCVIFFSGWED